jgi:hypothetical protein
MDIKTCCIDSRKNAIFASYNVQDPGTIKMINDYFDKVNEFAKDCKDVQDFEAKFAASELNKEYTDLFTMVMQTEADVNGNMPVQETEEEYTLHDEMMDDVNRAVRRRARQDIYDAARSVPGLGDAITAKQHYDFLSRFKKKKDE